MADPDEQVVRFSVKELFLDLKNDLKRIEGKLEHLATQADLDALDERVTILETTSASNTAIASYRKWLIGLAIGVIGLGLTFATDIAFGLARSAQVAK